MLWVEFHCVWAERDPGAFTYCARKKQRVAKEKSAAIVCYLQNAVLHPALLNRKTSYLMQYLVSNTNMESVSSSKKKKRKKYQLSCIYLLDKCKGFLPFHVWILWKQNPFSFDLQSTYCSFLIVWVDVGIVWPSLFMWTVCVCGVRVRVCWFVSLKQYEWWLYLWVEMLRNIN